MTEPLTKKQQELITLNHKLIYSFAYSKNLHIDDFYDILAIGMCKAAKAYDESKGKFSYFAYCCMNNELKEYYRHIKQQRAIPNKAILSYDNFMPNKEGFEVDLLEILSDDYSVQDMVINDITTNEFIQRLDDRQKLIVKLLMEGITQTEIASYLNCTIQNIHRIVMIIRKKWTTYTNKQGYMQ